MLVFFHRRSFCSLSFFVAGPFGAVVSLFEGRRKTTVSLSEEDSTHFSEKAIQSAVWAHARGRTHKHVHLQTRTIAQRGGRHSFLTHKNTLSCILFPVLARFDSNDFATHVSELAQTRLPVADGAASCVRKRTQDSSPAAARGGIVPFATPSKCSWWIHGYGGALVFNWRYGIWI